MLGSVLNDRDIYIYIMINKTDVAPVPYRVCIPVTEAERNPHK